MENLAKLKKNSTNFETIDEQKFDNSYKMFLQKQANNNEGENNSVGTNSPCSSISSTLYIDENAQTNSSQQGLVDDKPTFENNQLETPIVENSQSETLILEKSQSEGEKLELCNKETWNKLNEAGKPEMVLTRPGRRMFPTIKVRLTNLNPTSQYILFLKFEPATNLKHKWDRDRMEWQATFCGDPQPDTLGHVHRMSPSSGEDWMKYEEVDFDQVFLTNCRETALAKEFSLLSSMMKYQPVFSLIRLDNQSNQTNHIKQFTFRENEFIAVTAYQNQTIKQWKIDNNPYAKGFRAGGNWSSSRKRKEAEASMQLGTNMTSTNTGNNWLNSMTPRFNTNLQSVLNMNNLANVNSPPSMLANVNSPTSMLTNVNSPPSMLANIDENHFRAALNLNNQKCDGPRLPPKLPRFDIPGAGFMPETTFTPNIPSPNLIPTPTFNPLLVDQFNKMLMKNYLDWFEFCKRQQNHNLMRQCYRWMASQSKNLPSPQTDLPNFANFQKSNVDVVKKENQ